MRLDGFVDEIVKIANYDGRNPAHREDRRKWVRTGAAVGGTSGAAYGGSIAAGLAKAYGRKAGMLGLAAVPFTTATGAMTGALTGAGSHAVKSKIAVRLTQDEEKEQAIKFTGVGATSVPAVSALRNKITSGQTIPSGVKPGRWAAGQLATGAALFGALPAARHVIEQGTQDDAEERLRRVRISRALKEYHATKADLA